MRVPGDGEGVVPRRMEGGIPGPASTATGGQGDPTLASGSAELVVLFEQCGDFAANDAAERWLRERGYSVGVMQYGAPRGVLHGAHDISKWRNLRKQERLELDGQLIGNFRDGPIVLRIWNAPEAARAGTRVAAQVDREDSRDEKPNPEGGER